MSLRMWAIIVIIGICVEGYWVWKSSKGKTPAQNAAEGCAGCLILVAAPFVVIFVLILLAMLFYGGHKM